MQVKTYYHDPVTREAASSDITREMTTLRISPSVCLIFPFSTRSNPESYERPQVCTLIMVHERANGPIRPRPSQHFRWSTQYIVWCSLMWLMPLRSLSNCDYEL